MSANLLPSERVLWAGSLAHSPIFEFSDLYRVPFSIMWCGFAVFWEWTVLRERAPLFSDLWGLMFVLIGLYFVAGRLVVRWLALSNTEYTVTDQRIVVNYSILGIKREHSEYLTNLPPPVLRESSDGTGTIRFGSDSDVSSMFIYRSGSGRRRVIELRAVENARFVRDTIAEARARRR